MNHSIVSGNPNDRSSLPAAAGTRIGANSPPPLPRWRMWLATIGLLAMSACAAATSNGTDGPKPDWTLKDMPSQQGRTVLVTGGTSGIGLEAAKALAMAGAHVVIAARDSAERGNEVVAQIRQQVPNAHVQYEAFDLADLDSVRALAARLQASLPRLDVLVNNAAIMAPPERGASPQGFEMQFAVNYLGHFVLTAELLPLLHKAEAPRVVTQSSVAAHNGRIDLADLQATQAYDPMRSYAQSKLACLMFALELQRRSDAAGWGLLSMASHPGLSRTNLNASRLPRRLAPFLFQPASRGALPVLYAATAPEVRGGGYYGPTGIREIRGPLGFARVPKAATDAATATRLWTASENLTGTHFPPAPLPATANAAIHPNWSNR